MARAKFKRAVIQILTKIQAYHLYEKIKRNKLCVIPVNTFVKDFKTSYNPAQDQ
jgi:Ca2+/Na+ antiporter